MLKLTDLGDGSAPPPVSQRGGFIIEDLDNGAKVGSFNAKFKVRVGGGTETPAQGFSFSFGPDIPDAGIGEGGAGTGLIVSFDTVDNTAGFGADGNDPGDAPGSGTLVRGGLTYREAHLALEKIAEAGGMRSIELVEINTALDINNRTAEIGVKLILSALGKTIL